MKVHFWGTRGQMPLSSRDNPNYGGDTACVEVTAANGARLIFDAGSGMVRLGADLPGSGAVSVFITSRRAACWQGLGLFAPLFRPGWTVDVYAPAGLEDLAALLADERISPPLVGTIRAALRVHAIRPGTVTVLEGVTVDATEGQLPGDSLNYRVTEGDISFFYGSDTETAAIPALGPDTAPDNAPDIAVLTPPPALVRDLPALEAWVRSAWNMRESSGMSVLSRHLPHLDDVELERRETYFAASANAGILTACDDMRVTLPTGIVRRPMNANWFRCAVDSFALYKDKHVLLDRILFTCRELASAEAGTVYIRDGDELVFSYTHNDKLFPVDTAHRHAYLNMRIPLSKKSIAGYAGVTRESLNIVDVRSLPHDAPYSFNASFDDSTGYRTVSTLTVPVISRTGSLLGVIQLLNARSDEGEVRPFSASVQRRVQLLAREAASVIEHSDNLNRGIERLLRIISLHDAAETAQHARRVGAVSAEIYQQWAAARGESPDAIRQYKSQLRLAAMLHDIGKVGVSDRVLKKRGRLDDAEKRIMAAHASLGAELFPEEDNDISALAAQTARHHHQKWDGSGTCGQGETPPLAGEAIPLPARITALADVFDSLAAPREYSGAWNFEDAADLVRAQASKHFDPEIVERFLEIQDIVADIYRRYPEEG